jgi:HEAT repeat protein
MRLYQNTLLAVGILAGWATLLVAEESNLGELTRELRGEKPAAERTPAQREAVYVQVLGSLMADLASEDVGRRGGAQGTLEQIAFYASRPGAEADRAACAKAIAAQLSPASGSLARVWLLRQLERIGRAEAVPAVAGLLAEADAVVRESARRALQKNPAPEANAALQQAAAAADAPAWRVALLNALSERRDPANLALLIKEAATDQDDIRTSAIIGLAKLGDSSAASAIAAAMNRGTPAARRIATDSCLRLAEAVANRGDKTTALGIYRKLLAAEGHWKCAAIIGIGRTGSVQDLPPVFEALNDQDVRVRGACVEALCQMQGSEVTAAILAQVKSPKPEVRLALLQALARRGDKGTAAVFLAAAEDADEAVRVAALAGLGVIGNPSAVPLLLKAATTSGPAQEAARQSLQSLAGGEIDGALIAAMAEKDPKARVEAVRALAARHVVAATQRLLESAADADGELRNESLRALGVVAPSEALPALAALLIKAPDDGFRNEAANALIKIVNRDQDFDHRSEPVIQAASSCAGPARLALLGVLGRVGGRNSLESLLAAVKDNDPQVRDAAVRALAEWPDMTAAEDLLALAKGAASETHQVLALRGYLRVCRIRGERPDAERAKMLIAGLEAARRPDEKRQALGGLAEIRERLAFQAVLPYLGDDALKEEAASAAVRIGRDLWNQHPAAVEAAMQKVLEVSKNDGLKRDAQETLDRIRQKR